MIYEKNGVCVEIKGSNAYSNGKLYMEFVSDKEASEWFEDNNWNKI